MKSGGMKYGREEEWNEGIGEKLFVCERERERESGKKSGIGKIDSMETWKKKMRNKISGKLEVWKFGK